MPSSKVLFVSNLDWALYNFHLPIARALRNQGFEVTLVSPRGEYAARMESEGFEFIPWPLQRKSLNPFAEILSIWRLTRIYMREKPDAVHHFFIKPNIYGTIAARIARVPKIINTWEGLGLTFTQSLRGRMLRALIIPIARIVLRTRRLWTIHVNAENIQTFERLKLGEPDRVSLVPSVGVDTERFKAGNTESTSAPAVLMISRLLWDKGVAEYVEAANLLRQRGVHARFLLCGAPDDGNPLSVPNHTVDQWREDGVVELLGQRDDIPDVLRQAAIVVLPSYHEGLPRILLEAAATSLPLVATDIPGSREVVRDGVNGLLVPPREVVPLADAIQRLLEDPDLRIRFGIASRQIAETEFSEPVMLKQYLEAYNLADILDAPMNR